MSHRMKAVISQTLFGQLIQNRLWFNVLDESRTVDQVCAVVWNSWVNTVKVFQHSGLRYTSVQVTMVDEAVNDSFTELRNLTGNQAEETQGVSFGAAVLRFQTGKAGRQFHGRYYAAGYRQGGTQFGQFKSDEAANWQTQINILQNLFCGTDDTPSGLQLVVRGEHVIHNTPVKTIGLNPIIGVQRRRNLGVGA